MVFAVFSRSRFQFKSVSLRTNEEFVRLYNEIAESGCLKFKKTIWYVDQLMKRAEKYAELSELLVGIMLQFVQKIFPALRNVRFYGADERLFISDLCIFMLDPELLLEDLLEVFAESSGLESTHKVVVSALALLSFVYQYLIGCVDKGGSKSYSPGSLLFRLIFVAIVLFLGSYVWIKSRQTSYTANRRKRKYCPLADPASQLGDESNVPAGVYRRAVRDTRGSVTHYKYEPRLKPRREKLESGTSLEFNYLSLGSYDTPREAELVRHIAAVLYGKEEVCPVQFEDGLCLPFPSVTEPESCPPSGKEKAVWVTHKTKDLYAELLEEKARRLQLLHPAVETGSHDGYDVEARRSDPSPSAPGAPGAPSTAIELTYFTSPHEGNCVVEHSKNSESHGLRQEAILAREVFSVSSDCDFEQFISSLLQPEENDVDKVEGDYSETDRVFGFKSSLVPPQSSALDIPTSAIFPNVPQLVDGDQGLEIVTPNLNSATFQQFESLPEQVQLQQRVTCQEKRLEEFSGLNVELQQRLLESEVRILELHQKLRKSEVENGKWRSMCRQWRSMFRQLANLISASDEDGSPVDIQ